MLGGVAQLEAKLQQQWRGLEAAREGSLKHRLYRHEHSLLGAAGLGSLAGQGRSSRPAFHLVPCCLAWPGLRLCTLLVHPACLWLLRPSQGV